MQKGDPSRWPKKRVPVPRGLSFRSPVGLILVLEPSCVHRVGLEVKIAQEVDRIGRATRAMGYKQGICLRQVLLEDYQTRVALDRSPGTFFFDPNMPVEVVGCIDGISEIILDAIPEDKHRKAIQPL